MQKSTISHGYKGQNELQEKLRVTKTKKTFTETFDRIKFKQNPGKIVPNIS